MEVGRLELGVILSESSLEQAYRRLEEKFKNFKLNINISPKIDCDEIARHLDTCLDEKIRRLKTKRIKLGIDLEPSDSNIPTGYRGSGRNRAQVNQNFQDNTLREILNELKRSRRKAEAQVFEQRKPNTLDASQAQALSRQATDTLRNVKGINPNQNYQVQLNFKEGINSRGGYQQLITSIKEVNKSVRRNYKKDRGFLGNAVVGAQERLGVNLSKQISNGVRDVFGKEAGQSARKFVRSGSKAFKTTFLDNDEFNRNILEIQNSFSERMSKASFKLADGLIAVLEDRKGSLTDKINKFTETISTDVSFQDVARQAAVEYGAAGKKLVRSIFSESALREFTEPIGEKLKNRRERAIEEKAIPLVRERALEILNQKRAKNSAKVVTDDTQELFIATGGYAGARGLSGARLAKEINAEKVAGREAIWVKNTDTDIPKESMSRAQSKLIALLTSISKPNLRGYSLDALEMAAQALAAKERNPDVQIKILGESGGGFAAEETNKILSMLGIDSDFLGVGTPNFVGGFDQGDRRIISPDETLGAETNKVYARLGLANITPGQQILGVTGHPYEHYREKNVAELQNFLKGSPGQVTPEIMSDFRKGVDYFQQQNVKELDTRQVEQLAEAAYANMQHIRRFLLVAGEDTKDELQQIVNDFERVFVDLAPESREFNEVRQSLTKAKEYLEYLQKQPSIEAALVGGQIEKELAQAHKVLLSQKTTGTQTKKQEQLSQEISTVRKALKDPNLGLKPRIESSTSTEDLQAPVEEIVASSQELISQVQEVQQATEDILQARLQTITAIVDNFQNVYKEQFKAALQSGDDTKVEAVGKELLQDYAGIQGLIQQTKTQYGLSGTGGSKENKQFNQLLSRTKRTKNTITRKLTVKGIDIPEELARGIKDGAQLPIDEVEKIANDVIQKAKDTFETESPSKVFRGIGQDVVEGLILGFQQREKEPVEVIQNVADQVIQGAKDAFEIQSPSKVFQRIGQFISAGLTNGIEGGLEETKSLFGDIVEETQKLFESVKTQGQAQSQGLLGNILGKGKSLVQLTAFAAVLSKIIPRMTQFATEALEVSANMQVLERRLEFVSGGSVAGQEQISALKNQAERIGINPAATLESASGLIASSRSNPLAISEATKGQMALNQAAKVYGLTVDEQSRAAVALSQSLDKQVVSQEELRQQLAEALPRALGTASDAYGVTTQKLNQMVTQGLDASEFFRKFTEQLEIETAGGLAGALGTVQGKQGLVDAKAFGLQKEVGDALLPLKGFSLDAINIGLDVLKASIPVVTALLTALAGKMTLLATVTLVDFVKSATLTKASMVGLAGSIKAVKTATIAFAKEFAVMFAIGASIKYVVDRFSDLSGELRTQIDAVKDLRKEFKELTRVQGQASDINGFQVAGERFVVGLKDFFTGEVKAVKDSFKAINDSIKLTQSIAETATSSSTTELLNNIARVDKAIADVQTKKRALSVNDPNNKDGLRKLNEEERRLLKERAEVSKTPTNIRKQLAAQIDAIKTQLEYLKKVKREFPLYGEEVENVDKAISKLTQDQEKLEKLQIGISAKLSKATTAFDLLQRSIKRVGDSFADLNDKSQLFFNNQRIAAVLGNTSPEQQQFQTQTIDVQANSFQLQQARKQYSQTRALLDTDENRTIMQNFGVDFDTGANRINTLLEQTTNLKDKFVFETLAQLKQQQVNISELSVATVTARKELENQFREISKQVDEYYLETTRNAKQTGLEVQRLTNETKNQKLQNQLKQILTDGYDTIVGSIVEGISSALDNFNSATDAILENQQNQLTNSFELIDANKANLEIQKQIPTVDVRLDFSSIPTDNNITALNDEVNQTITGTDQLGVAMQGVNQSSETLFGTLNGLLEPLMYAKNDTKEWGDKTNEIPNSFKEVSNALTEVDTRFNGILGKTIEWIGQLTNAPGLIGQALQAATSGNMFTNEQGGNKLLSLFAGKGNSEVLEPVDRKKYRITSGFGWRTIFGKRDFHEGLDYGTPVGTPVKAPVSGKVTHAGSLGSAGITVKIKGIDSQGNKTEDMLLHLSNTLVKVGDLVTQGQVVARSGETGRGTGPHLDWRRKVNGKWQNPQVALNQSRKVARRAPSGGNVPGKYANTSNKLSSEFLAGVSAVAAQLGTKPEYLLAVMGFETGGTFSPSKQNSLGFTGLIQFSPKYSPSVIGKTTNQLKNMSQMEQLQYVAPYINTNRRGKSVSSLEDLYMSVLMPSLVGKGSNANLPGWAYRANRGLDIDKNGKISVKEATQKVRDYLPNQETTARLYGSQGLRQRASSGLAQQTTAINQRAVAQKESTSVKREGNIIAGDTALARVRRQTTRALRDMKKQTLSDRRALTDLQFESIPFPTKAQQNLKESTTNLRQYQDTLQSLRERLEDTNAVANQADKAISVFNSQLAGGGLDANQRKAIETGITQNTKLKEQALKDKASIQQTISETEKAFKGKEAARVEKANFEEYLRASRAAIDSQTQENATLQEKINHLEKVKEISPGTLGLENLPQLREQLALRQLEVDTASKLLQVEDDIKKSGNDPVIVTEKQKVLQQLEKENDLKVKQIRLTRKQQEEELKLASSQRDRQIRGKFAEISSQLQEEKIRSITNTNKRLGFSQDAGTLSKARYESFNNQRTTLGLNLENEIAEIKAFGKETGLPAQKVNELITSLKELNEVKLANLKQEFEETLGTDQLEQLSKVRETLEAQFQLKTKPTLDLKNAQAENLEAKGNVLGARKLRSEAQRTQELFNRQQQIKQLDEQVLEARRRGIDVTDKEVERLKANIIELSEINLENLNNQFNPWVEVSRAGIDGLKGSIKGLIRGTMDLGDAFQNIGASIADTLASLAAEWLTNELVQSLFGIGKKKEPSSPFGAFDIGSGSGGGVFGSVLGLASGVFGFSSGGIVPSDPTFNNLRKSNGALGQALRKEGGNSILATLTPGERVLTIKEADMYRKMFPQGIMSYSRGGDVGNLNTSTNFSTLTANNKNGHTVNLVVNYQGSGGNSRAEQLGSFVRAAVVAELDRQSEPGGRLS